MFSIVILASFAPTAPRALVRRLRCSLFAPRAALCETRAALIAELRALPVVLSAVWAVHRARSDRSVRNSSKSRSKMRMPVSLMAAANSSKVRSTSDAGPFSANWAHTRVPSVEIPCRPAL